MSNTILIGATFLALGALAVLKLKTSGDDLSTVGDVPSDALAYLNYNLGPAFGASVSYDQDTLARTIYGEARGQGRAAMANVASVIMNRWALRQNGDGYASFGPVGATVAQICLAPSQFSCWNSNDPNAAICRQATASDPAFASALDVAGQALAGTLPDATGGADHYFAATLANIPSWAKSAAETVSDGAHNFFKLIG